MQEPAEEEIDQMANKIALEEEKIEDEDKEMEEAEEEERRDLYCAPQDSRNALGLMKRILRNNKVAEVFNAVPNKK